jgi:anti-sigma regulatory factor (Ser/Thr protein kinase)
VNGPSHATGRIASEGEEAYRLLADFALPSVPGNERVAMELVAAAVEDLGLPAPLLERLKTAVAEATMNAMEHGNNYRPEMPVTVRVLASKEALSVLITDQGAGSVPETDVATPDLRAKLEGRQSPRGWGLFLIQHMVDEMNVTASDTHHTVELVLHLRVKGDGDANQTA